MGAGVATVGEYPSTLDNNDVVEVAVNASPLYNLEFMASGADVSWGTGKTTLTINNATANVFVTITGTQLPTPIG